MSLAAAFAFCSTAISLPEHRWLAGVSPLQGAGASMSMCSSCCWIVHRSGSSSGTGGATDGAGGGGNSGCDVVAAVFGLASGVCSVFTLLLPLPFDRAPQVRWSLLFLRLLLPAAAGDADI